jgi:hypothetical protein
MRVWVVLTWESNWYIINSILDSHEGAELRCEFLRAHGIGCYWEIHTVEVMP